MDANWDVRIHTMKNARTKATMHQRMNTVMGRLMEACWTLKCDTCNKDDDAKMAHSTETCAAQTTSWAERAERVERAEELRGLRS
eukprot:7155371-Alexandrium_andersonii.AAC.1